jgi:hypothetical protein
MRTMLIVPQHFQSDHIALEMRGRDNICGPQADDSTFR